MWILDSATVPVYKLDDQGGRERRREKKEGKKEEGEEDEERRWFDLQSVACWESAVR